MIFQRSLLVLLLLPAVSVYADRCKKSVALLGNDSDSSHEVPRQEVLDQIAGLYSAAINGETSMEMALSLMKELAGREARSVADVRQEVELMLYSQSERDERAEERRQKRTEELLRFHEGLEPYLARLGTEHRKIIEKQILHRGLLNPLSTGEVEFWIQGKYTFWVGDEGLWGAKMGQKKEVSFEPWEDFAIGQVPVTQFMYFLAALGENDVDPTPSVFKEGEGAVVLHLGDKTYHFKPNHPVENVNHLEAESHASRVSKIMGNTYGLPNEIQWELANRSKSPDYYHFGDGTWPYFEPGWSLGKDGWSLGKYGWFNENSGWETHEVGQLLGNAYHLHDTHGNVSEWTSTMNDGDFIFRGGSYKDSATHLRSAYRGSSSPERRESFRGFRLKRQSTFTIRPSYLFRLGHPEPTMPRGMW
jgi:formylglycine-generating enzyme required for sulfatase activity